MMGDSLYTNFKMLKKLNFDDTTQWLFYDDGLKDFFEFFTQNITDENILTEEESLERNDIINKCEEIDEVKLEAQLQELNSLFPGMINCKVSEQNWTATNCTDERLELLTKEYEELYGLEEQYTTLKEELEISKENASMQLYDLESNFKSLSEVVVNQMNKCQESVKNLENVQRENCLLQKEATDSFSKKVSPPLFIHQLPIEQYLQKCDIFMQLFNQYIEGNFKIEDYLSEHNQSTEADEITIELGNLRKSLEYWMMKNIMAKCHTNAVRDFIQLLNNNQISINNMNELKQETRRLNIIIQNQDQTSTMLQSELQTCVKERTKQLMELILSENTKEKFDRALKRQDDLQRVYKIVFDAISNSELVWILTQLDLEKTRNRFDNSSELMAENQNCLRRINLMQTVDDTRSEADRSNNFTELMADLLAQHLKQNIRSEPKACLQEYEKLCRLQNYTIGHLMSKNHYLLVFEQFEKINGLEKFLKPFVYDGPLITPMLNNLRFVQSIFDASLAQKQLVNELRSLRQKFQNNIVMRMNKDKLWSNYQLLWIWFLTDPNRLAMAIDEVKRAAARFSSTSGLRSLGGIKKRPDRDC